jgi:hypothetical protein
MVRDDIRLLCKAWGITDLDSEIDKLCDAAPYPDPTDEEVESQLAREAAEYRRQTGRDLESDLELMDLMDGFGMN